MSHYFDSDKKRWRFTFNRVIDGQRVRATKLLPKGWSRSQAEKYDHQETARLFAVASGVHQSEPLIDQAVALYLDHRTPQLRNGKRIAQELAHLVPFFEGRPVSAFADVGREYMAANPDLADGTLHNRLAYLKAAGRYAWKKHGLTPHDPTGRMEVPKPNNARVVRQSVADLERLLAAIADDKARALFTLAFYCGLRWMLEALPRRPDDVIRDGGDVGLLIGYTKNGSPRIVPVHPKARWALQHLPFDDYSESYYRDRFNAARDAAGLAGFRRHDMRHVLGADVVRRTGNQRDAMEALHHLSYQASMRYTMFATSRLRDVLFGVGDGRKMHTKARRRSPRKVA
jgi:integrase